MSPPRHIYAVRHAERVDDVEGKKKCWYLNSHFNMDNPPLSTRGFVQACELHEEFRNIPIDYCFSSPYERCVQTASAILEGRPNVKINIEPGLLESLHVIYERSEVKRLDFQTNRELIHRFPNINQIYKPVFLAPPAGEELKGVQGCFDRVGETVRMIINKCQGDILIVSHMHPLAAIQRILTGRSGYGGIATVSKVIWYIESPRFEGCFSAEYLYDSSHLSDKTRLNGKDFNRKEAKTAKK